MPVHTQRQPPSSGLTVFSHFLLPRSLLGPVVLTSLYFLSPRPDPNFEVFEGDAAEHNPGCTGPSWEVAAGIFLLVIYMLIMAILM